MFGWYMNVNGYSRNILMLIATINFYFCMLLHWNLVSLHTVIHWFQQKEEEEWFQLLRVPEPIIHLSSSTLYKAIICSLCCFPLPPSVSCIDLLPESIKKEEKNDNCEKKEHRNLIAYLTSWKTEWCPWSFLPLCLWISHGALCALPTGRESWVGTFIVVIRKPESTLE